MLEPKNQFALWAVSINATPAKALLLPIPGN
jgi:hypothetical protein